MDSFYFYQHYHFLYVYNRLFNIFSTRYSQPPEDNAALISVSKDTNFFNKIMFNKCIFEKVLFFVYFMLVFCLAQFFSHFPQVILFQDSLYILFYFFKCMHYCCMILFSKSFSNLRKRLICKYSTKIHSNLSWKSYII